MNFTNGFAFLNSISISFILMLLIFTLTRFVMMLNFVDKSILQNINNRKDIKRMLWLGLRFDAKVIAIISVIPLLFGTITSLFLQDLTTLANISTTFYFVISLFAFLIISGNFFYYKTYNNYYDVFIFALKEEDTKAVLKNIYDDYPIIKYTLLNVLLAYLIASIHYHCTTQLEISSNNGILFSVIFIFLILGTALLARGTLRSVPLGRYHAQISSISSLNKLVPNGIIAIDWAMTDRKQQFKFHQVDKSEGEYLVKAALNTNSFINYTPQNDFLTANKPNIVLTMMESFGSNGLYFDDPIDNDLLGSLRKVFEEDFVFKRFLSGDNGTMASLTSLYLNCHLYTIAQSEAQKKVLEDNPFLLYKNQGYKTIFITSGNLMWRNLGSYLPIQGVDELYDQNTLIDLYPEAKNTLSYWGVADEFSFKLAEKILQESSQPLFINILTITNHPPYAAPSHYTANKVNGELISDRFGNTEKERENLFKAYQYSTNALGHFFANVKKSNIADHTILAAVGDHHIRGFKAKVPQELFLSYGVPFILSIPKAFQQNISFDPNIIGSYKDIFPTLFSLSLSEVAYYNLGGRNLLSKDENKDFQFAYNPLVWADNTGVHDLASPDYNKYAWENASSLLVKADKIEASQEEKEKIASYIKLLDWQIHKRVMGCI